MSQDVRNRHKRVLMWAVGLAVGACFLGTIGLWVLYQMGYIQVVSRLSSAPEP